MRKNVITNLIIFLFVICSLVSLTGCTDSTRNFDGKVKVVYQLEGGIYQNCEQPVIQYYSFDDGEGHLIMVGYDIPKSFVLYREGSSYQVCFSQLSTSSLYGRLSKPFETE